MARTRGNWGEPADGTATGDVLPALVSQEHLCVRGQMRQGRGRGMTGVAQEGWSLGDNDRALLRQVVTAVRRLLPLARSKDDLVAVGQALEAVERVRDGAGVEAAVVLSVGIQDGNAAFGEGWFARLGVGPEGIVLDKLNTTFSVEIGLDRATTCFAVLKPDGGFDGAGVAAWLDEVNCLRQWSTAEIQGERYPL